VSAVDAVTDAANPIGDASRAHRLLKVVGWIAAAVALHPAGRISARARRLRAHPDGTRGRLGAQRALPGNLGSIVMLFMFVAIIPGASFAGVFAGYLVQRIFFSVAGALVYVYLSYSRAARRVAEEHKKRESSPKAIEPQAR
jgi:hypothetical protein